MALASLHRCGLIFVAAAVAASTCDPHRGPNPGLS
jgi:hypothetical protein